MICLSFDIEERFHSHLSASGTSRDWLLRDRISKIIDYLIEHKKSATFFVVGELAEQYPDLVRRMSDSGFEVGAHGYQHRHLGRVSVQEGRNEISQSKSILEDITGRQVVGFRAPSWSAQRSDDWYWECLLELGFRYDSSLFPYQTNLYGSNSNLISPFQIRPGLLEIPPSVFKYGLIRIPFGGGFFFRFYPLMATEWFLNHNTQRGELSVLYFHPWEFEPDYMPPENGVLNRMVGNINIKKNWDKFTVLIDRHPCRSLCDFYDTQGI